jgi:hypothetical protein
VLVGLEALGKLTPVMSGWILELGMMQVTW